MASFIETMKTIKGMKLELLKVLGSMLLFACLVMLIALAFYG
jgi:hypothetical protein